LTPFLYVLRGEGEPEDIRVEGGKESWRITRGGKTTEVSATRLPDGRLSLLLPDGSQICGRVHAAAAGEVDVIRPDGQRRVRLADPLSDRLAHATGPAAPPGDEEIRTLMPGRVVEVRVAEGDRVEAGQVLVVLEAMKMQNEIRASASGRVVRSQVQAGDTVEGRSLLLVIHSGPNP
jgi:biotin carboxyl carrier protein